MTYAPSRLVGVDVHAEVAVGDAAGQHRQAERAPDELGHPLHRGDELLPELALELPVRHGVCQTMTASPLAGSASNFSRWMRPRSTAR